MEEITQEKRDELKLFLDTECPEFSKSDFIHLCHTHQMDKVQEFIDKVRG